MLKSNKFMYHIYYLVVSFALRVVGIFLKTDDRLILFNSFGGKKYDDSPKAIYEEMRRDSRFSSYRLVWAIQRPENMDLPDDMEVVRGDTWAFFKTALKARCWITNSSMERGLNFKKPDTFYLNTWHGTAIKKMGSDIAASNQSFSAQLSPVDIMLAQSQYDVDIFSRVFSIRADHFCCTGLPRNDILAHYTQEMVEDVKRKLGLPEGKKVILYAPTFREYERGEQKQCVLSIPMDLEYWNERLGEEYVVLFRAHYEVAEHMNVNQCAMFLDVSAYPTLNDLMIVSDILITDYSSICFDYSIMGKPIFFYVYDYDEYKEKRGIYFELEDEFPSGVVRTQEELLDQISDMDLDQCEGMTQRFRDKYVAEYGEAAKLTCDLIISSLKDNLNY